MLRRAKCKKCGGEVTREWSDLVTYPCVFDDDGVEIVGFEDESVYTSDGDPIDTGYFCNGECGEYIGEDEVEPGDEYEIVAPKLEAVMDAVQFLRAVPHGGELADRLVATHGIKELSTEE